MTTAPNTSMTIKRSILASTALLLLAACADHDHNGEDHDDHGPEPLVYTHYTETTELFVEFPPLVVGETSRALAHFTRMADHTPVKEGTVDALLQKAGQTVARFRVSAPTRDGLFTPEITPRDTGEFQLLIQLSGPALNATHDLGSVRVYPTADQVDVHQAEPEGDISYLKEQQWEANFATALVAERPLRPSVPGFATVMAPNDGGAIILAPEDGYFAGVDIAKAGMTVAAGDVLGFLVPRLGAGRDWGDALVALQRARSELELSDRELQRVTGLVAKGAVPERRLHEARQAHAIAETEVRTAQARVNQRQGDDGAAGVALRAPVSGEVVESRVRPGAMVSEGDRVFRIAERERRWLQVRVAEHFARDLSAASGLWLELPGASPMMLDADSGASIVQVETAIEPGTRTASVTLEYASTQGPTLLGSRYPARVFTSAPESRLTVPRSSLVDDGGRQVVFVHTSGETFARRVVETGMIDGPWVEVLRGVNAGERVVSEGAYYVRLAAAGGDDIGHGHAH